MGDKREMTDAVVTLLQKENINFSLTKWEPHDFMIRVELSEIVQNVDIFSRVISQIDLTHFQETNDFLDYLFIKKIDYLWSITDSIVENKEAKEKIERVYNIAKEHLQRLNKSQLISFLNKHYREIFSISCTPKLLIWPEREIMEEVLAFQNGGISKDVYVFLLEEHPSFLRGNFKGLWKKFEENPEWFEKLCATEEKTTCGDLITFITNYSPIFVPIWRRKNSNLKRCVEENVKEIINRVRQFVTEVTSGLSDEVIVTMDLVTKGSMLLKDLAWELPIVEADQLQVLYERYNAPSNPFWKKFSFTIHENDLSKVVTELARHPNKQMRVLSMTHNYHPSVSNTWLHLRSSLDSDYLPKAHSILDAFSCINPTNEYFTFTRQLYLRVYFEHIRIFACVILRETSWLNDVMETQTGMMVFLHRKLGIPEKLIVDSCILEGMMRSINFGDDYRDIIQPSCYGASMFVCALIEKLLREVWKALDGGKHEVPQGAAALRTLLEDSSGVFRNIFGENHLRNLSYFLCNVGKDNSIGFGLRNRLAHWDEISAQALSSGLVAFLYYLYQDILNTLFIYFYKQEDCCTERPSECQDTNNSSV